MLAHMPLLDLLLPPSCAGCTRLGALLCNVCRAQLREPTPEADRFFAANAGAVIGDMLEVALAAFAYEGVVRRVLQRLKYGGAARVAIPLADAALPAFRSLLAISGKAPLVPVPVHVVRRRERGYNQATLLAEQLGRRARLPVAELLVRPRPTTKQHRLDHPVVSRRAPIEDVDRIGLCVEEDEELMTQLLHAGDGILVEHRLHVEALDLDDRRPAPGLVGGHCGAGIRLERTLAFARQDGLRLVHVAQARIARSLLAAHQLALQFVQQPVERRHRVRT
jgi:predicted amidophosphoribosyltransferase